MSDHFHHVTVLKQQAVEMLGVAPDMTVIDCTAGGGGHTELILSRLQNQGLVVAFDQDQTAIEHLENKFSSEISDGFLQLVPRNFSELRESCDRMNLEAPDAILADIGVSSPQIDEGERGFSFAKEGPLDMRMDQSAPLTAKKVVNEFEEKDLAHIIWKFGEEPKSRPIAKAICEARKTKTIETTMQLSAIVADAARYPTKSRKNPATKTFQALRIYVNRELEVLEQLIQDGFKLLKPQGRMAIITFHSLEDRIVKKAFKKLSQPTMPSHMLRSAALPQAEIEAMTSARIIKPFPQIASEEEIAENPRARSAKLRVIEKK